MSTIDYASLVKRAKDLSKSSDLNAIEKMRYELNYALDRAPNVKTREAIARQLFTLGRRASAVLLDPMRQFLRPCPFCDGIEYRVSKKMTVPSLVPGVTGPRFRMIVCRNCGWTGLFATSVKAIDANPNFVDLLRVADDRRGPYR